MLLHLFEAPHKPAPEVAREESLRPWVRVFRAREHVLRDRFHGRAEEPALVSAKEGGGSKRGGANGLDVGVVAVRVEGARAHVLEDVIGGHGKVTALELAVENASSCAHRGQRPSSSSSSSSERRQGRDRRGVERREREGGNGGGGGRRSLLGEKRRRRPGVEWLRVLRDAELLQRGWGRGDWSAQHAACFSSQLLLDMGGVLSNPAARVTAEESGADLAGGDAGLC
eukprot:772550-Rhodomonas_salina.1